MIIQDRVYKTVSLEEPVLEELIGSPSLNRLKDVSQYGIPDKYYCYKNLNRYEHSVGVMLLLRRLNRPLKEQIAGLLHDVSIFAFSHVADWLFGGGKSGTEDYHDSLHDKFIHQSEIPQILTKYGFLEEDVTDITKFSVLDTEIPNLCADRVDYAFREFDNWIKNHELIEKCLPAITVDKEMMVFNDIEAAFVFASSFLRLQVGNYGAPEPIRRYQLFSNALRQAMDLGIFVEKDFYDGETPILQKLESCKDEKIQTNLEILKNPEFPYVSHGEKIIKKFRHVDPLVLIGRDAKKLSNLKPGFGETLSRYREENKLGVEV